MTYVSTEMRRLVRERAGGCCEYCLAAEDASDSRFHIEHIIPSAQGGKTILDNLALSCPDCNWFKGSHIAGADPDTGEPTFLFRPRRHRWEEHFRLNGVIIEALTPEGRTTIFLLKMNDKNRIAERQKWLLIGSYPCEIPGI